MPQDTAKAVTTLFTDLKTGETIKRTVFTEGNFSRTYRVVNGNDVPFANNDIAFTQYGAWNVESGQPFASNGTSASLFPDGMPPLERLTYQAPTGERYSQWATPAVGDSDNRLRFGLENEKGAPVNFGRDVEINARGIFDAKTGDPIAKPIQTTQGPGATVQTVIEKPITASGDAPASAPAGTPPPTFASLAADNPLLKLSSDGNSGYFTNPITKVRKLVSTPQEAKSAIDSYNSTKTLGSNIREGLTPGGSPLDLGDNISVQLNKAGKVEVVQTLANGKTKTLGAYANENDAALRVQSEKSKIRAKGDASKDVKQGAGVVDGAPKRGGAKQFLSNMKKDPLKAMMVIGGGIGIFMTMKSMFANHKFGFGEMFGLVTSAASFGKGFQDLAAISGMAATYWTMGIVSTAAVVGWLATKYGKTVDREADATAGDPDLYQPWYKTLASPGNVLMIVAASALLSLSINLGTDGVATQSKNFAAAQLPAIRSVMDISAGSGKLPAIGTSVLGKVFIQASGNNGLSPDRIVYVSQTPTGTYDVNAVTLDSKGKMVGLNAPNGPKIPFFTIDSKGAVVATVEGSAAVAKEVAMAQASRAPQLNGPAQLTTITNAPGGNTVTPQ